jgi:hypothetical protein
MVPRTFAERVRRNLEVWKNVRRGRIERPLQTVESRE